MALLLGTLIVRTLKSLAHQRHKSHLFDFAYASHIRTVYNHVAQLDKAQIGEDVFLHCTLPLCHLKCKQTKGKQNKIHI